MIAVRQVLIWAALACAVVAPVAVATASPFLAWRDPIYIIAGFSGILGLALLLVQPLLITGRLPGLTSRTERRLHQWGGASLLLAVVIHVVGLWITSPPDVVDALLFRSPTPFSIWGVIAMWAVFLAAILAMIRRKLRLSPRVWRRCHIALAVVTVGGTIAHAMLIEGAMETLSKAALCVLVAIVMIKVVIDIAQKPTSRRRISR